jgi:hypothetical protein
MDDIAFKELTFRVEYAATPGAPLLILETVRVDKDNIFEVMVEVVKVDPAMEENTIDDTEIVEPVRVERDNAPVVIEAVEMEEPCMVLTVMAGATTFRRPR